MTDETPSHDTPTDPGAGTAPPPPAAAPIDPANRGRWWSRAGAARWQARRVPLVVSVLALLLGCMIGGAVVAVGAFVGDDHHGDRRGHSRDEYAGERGDDGQRGDDHRRGDRNRSDRRDGDRDDDAPASTAPSTAPSAPASTAPASSAPAPTASS